MTPKQLKASILQLAISGKLVPQDPNDEPASELLKRIENAKNAKGAKKGKPLQPITDDEKPFSIPDSWEWVRLMDIAKVITGNTPNKITTTFYGGNYKFFKPTDLDAGYNVYVASDSLSESGRKISRQLPKDSVLVTCIGATIGKAGIIRDEGTCNQQINALIPVLVLSEYIYFAVISDWFQNRMCTLSGKTTLPILNKSAFQQMLLPLPPLAEQKRIVAKIEALFKYVDECEDNRKELTEKLAEALKRSILQEAIQGRLVPQDPEDEPASELLKKISATKNAKGTKKSKPLSPITDGEKPFTIPDSWEWARIGNVSDVFNGNSINEQIKKTKYSKKCDGYSFIATPDVGFDSKINYESGVYIPKGEPKFRIAPEGSALMCIEGGSAARKFGFLNRDVMFGNKLCCFHATEISAKYIYWYLQSHTFYSAFQAKMTGIIGGVGPETLRSFPIPLPPLAEQKRIVAKVEALLAKVEPMKGV